MNSLPNNTRQITLYFNSKSRLGQKVLATAKASHAQLKSIDLSQSAISETEWVKIADVLDVDLFDLIDQEHPVFRDIYGNDKVELEERDALKILVNNPEILVYPVAIRGEKAIQVKQTNDLHSLINPDSGSIPHPKTEL